MTALQELIEKLDGNVKKSIVDYYLALERKQIEEAFEDGQYNGLRIDGEQLVPPAWYYNILFGADGRKPDFLLKD